MIIVERACPAIPVTELTYHGNSAEPESLLYSVPERKRQGGIDTAAAVGGLSSRAEQSHLA